MKAIIDVAVNKIKSVFNTLISVSAIIMNSDIDKTSSVRQKTRVYHCKVGKYTYIARNTLVQNSEIGAFCSISEDCNIGLPSHPASFVSTSPVFLEGSNYLRKSFANIKYDDCPRTTIGNDVWLGASVKIKSGITIGNGAIIAAGAVVTHDVPPYAIVGGVPAKVIRYRFDDETIQRLADSCWWNLSDSELTKCAQSISNADEFVKEVSAK